MIWLFSLVHAPLVLSNLTYQTKKSLILKTAEHHYLLVNCTYLFISSIIFIVNCHLMHVVCVECNGPHVSVTIVERDVNQQARILRFAVVVTRNLRVTSELCRVKTTFHATASLAVSGHANVRFQENDPTNDN